MDRSIVALALFAIAACEDGSAVSVHSVGDTVTVANQRPVHGDTIAMVLKARIGAFDGTIENEFQSIEAFAVDTNGDMYAFDRDVGLKRFTATGEFVGWVAGVGEGPGEVGCASALAARAGMVAVQDGCNRRLSIFSPSSAPFSVPLPEGMHRYGEDALAFDTQGELWLAINPTFPTDGGIAYPRPIAVRLEDGAFVDTVSVPSRYGELCPILSEARYRAGFWEDKREQWWPKVKWALGGDGRVAYGCPRRFRFDVVALDGAVLRVEKPWRPARTTADERRFYEQWWQPIPALPETRPAYARIVLEPGGRIWVWPEQPSESFEYNEDARRLTGRDHGWMAGTRGAFEVFAQDGRWLGAVRVPEELSYSGHPTTEPVVIRGDTVWGVITDSLDVEYLGRFEVDW